MRLKLAASIALATVLLAGCRVVPETSVPPVTTPVPPVTTPTAPVFANAAAVGSILLIIVAVVIVPYLIRTNRQEKR